MRKDHTSYSTEDWEELKRLRDANVWNGSFERANGYLEAIIKRFRNGQACLEGQEDCKPVCKPGSTEVSISVNRLTTGS